MDDKRLEKDALEYHSSNPPGKITVVPTKPHGTQRELSLAYSPGVAYPCNEIEKKPEKNIATKVKIVIHGFGKFIIS